MSSKIIFLGSKPIGYFCLEHLLQQQKVYDIEIVGVLTNNNTAMGAADLVSLAKEYDVPVFDQLDDIIATTCDYLISVQYHQILKKKHLAIATKQAINLHMAPLPEYRGCNQFTFALIDGKEEFGTTLHVMNEGIDSGDILAEKRFPIPKDCFVDQLYDLTLEASCSLFANQIGAILNDEITSIPQDFFLGKRTTSTHYRKEIRAAKKIDLNWDEDKIWRYVRATSMPGFTPPYAEVNGIKLNINIER
ncbi:MAG: formyltransferase family protein [Aureispira sp.]